MMKSALPVLALVASGCSTLDDQVTVSVKSAEIRVDPSKPASLADVQVTLLLHALSRADRVVGLGTVMFRTTNLAMAFPPGFDGHMHPNEEKTVVLVNATTNQQLASLCGAMDNLDARLTYADDPMAWSGSNLFAVTITCS